MQPIPIIRWTRGSSCVLGLVHGHGRGQPDPSSSSRARTGRPRQEHGPILRALDRTNALRVIWRLCAGGAASGARGVSGSTCTRPGRSRRSSSRNGSIARGAADTSSARERRRPALGCRNIREAGAPHKRAKLLSQYHALVLTSARRTRSAGRTMHSELNANRHRPPARSYDSDNRQGLAPCNEWRLS